MYEDDLSRLALAALVGAFLIWFSARCARDEDAAADGRAGPDDEV